MKYTKKEKEEYKARSRYALLEEFEAVRKRTGKPPVIYTEVSHVARSGMSRDVKVRYVDVDGQIGSLTWSVGNAIGNTPRDNAHGERVIKVGGCGFNAGLDVAQSLLYALYGTGAHLQQGNFERKGETPSFIWREL